METAQRMIHVHKQLHAHVRMSLTLFALNMVMAYDAETLYTIVNNFTGMLHAKSIPHI